MDHDSRRMLADLGIATRDSIVTSVTGKDEQDAASRANKLKQLRVTPATAAIQKKWNVLRQTNQPSDNDERDIYVATAPPVASNGNGTEGAAPRSMLANNTVNAPEAKGTMHGADSKGSPDKGKSKADKSTLPNRPKVEALHSSSRGQPGSQNLMLYKTMAEFFAGRPGDMADSYFRQFPERRVYLEQARIDIAKAMIELIKTPASDETKAYLSHHPDRQWMFDVTRMAMKDAGSGTEAVRSYYDTHPECKPFCLVAQEGRRRELSKHHRQFSTLPAPTTPVKAAESSNAQAAGGKRLQNNVSAPAVLSPDSETAAADTKTSPTKPIVNSPILSTSMSGSLDASCYDTLGNLIACHQVTVQKPVQATITLTVEAGLLNRTEAIVMMDNLACALDMPRHQIMPGVYDDGSGLYDVEDMLTALENMDLN